MILNHVDSYLQDTLYEHRDDLVLNDPKDESGMKQIDVAAEDGMKMVTTGTEMTGNSSICDSRIKADLIALLKFTTLLLHNAVGKELYNSAEVRCEYSCF